MLLWVLQFLPLGIFVNLSLLLSFFLCLELVRGLVFRKTFGIAGQGVRPEIFSIKRIFSRYSLTRIQGQHFLQ